MTGTLAELKGKLQKGDRRELARRLRVHPSKISDAFDDFVKDQDFLSELETETQRILNEREASTSI